MWEEAMFKIMPNESIFLNRTRNMYDGVQTLSFCSFCELITLETEVSFCFANENLWPFHFSIHVMLLAWSKGQIRVTHRTSPSLRHRHSFTHFLFLLSLSETYPWHSSPDITWQKSRYHYPARRCPTTYMYTSGRDKRTWFSFIRLFSICTPRPRVYAYWASFEFTTEQ
jgi:hypothetical protein